jgi:hypothetical protein
MLVDELKEDARKKRGRLFWVGYDPMRLQGGQIGDGESSPELDAEFESILDSATLYDCVPLAPALDKQLQGKSVRFVTDCFGPLPPHPITAIEQRMGQTRAIVLLQSSAVSEPPGILDYFLIENAVKRSGHAGVGIVKFTGRESRVLLAEAKWMVGVSVIIPLADHVVAMLDNFLAYFCGSRGQLLTSPIANHKLNEMLRDPAAANDPKSEAVKSLMEMGIKQFNYSHAILNLMACKNVVGERQVIPQKLQQARARRGKLPLVERRVLTVTLPGVRRATRTPTPDDLKREPGAPQPLQTIPGSYRDYRENGLFGRYKGIYWFPAHVRGTIEAGTLSKSYKAIPAANKQGDNSNETVPEN